MPGSGSVRTEILLDDNGISEVHQLVRKASDRDGGGGVGVGEKPSRPVD